MNVSSAFDYARTAALLLLVGCTGGAMPAPSGDDPGRATADAPGAVGASSPTPPGRGAPDAAPSSAPANSAPPATTPRDAAADRLNRDASPPPPPPHTGMVGCGQGGHVYPVCLDFETGSLPGTWKVSGPTLAVDSHAAHGEYAMHVGDVRPVVPRTFGTSDLGGITNVLWGRVYMSVDAGAPRGHGAVIVATDEAGYWYEVGFSANYLDTNWHYPPGVPEMPAGLNYKVTGGKWICLEFQFDGSVPSSAKVWVDGVQPKTLYSFGAPRRTVTRFKSVEFGFRPFHGTSLNSDNGSTAPALTDMWFDDIVLDTQRIGCD